MFSSTREELMEPKLQLDPSLTSTATLRVWFFR